jgi:hypothetical protein
MRPQERSLKFVPASVFAILLLSFAAQIGLHWQQPNSAIAARQLPTPLPAELLRAASFGEDLAAAKLLMLWLQNFDNQPGLSLPFSALDYTNLAAWLKRVLELDPQAQYPLLAASRVYSEVPDLEKQQLMLDFVEDEFKRDPNRRWPWMAHVVYVAKHRMKNPQLALHYARSLSAHAVGPEVPHWAKQMEIFVLEDMGELESAKVLLGGLLDSGKITDPNEQWFLSNRLAEINRRVGRIDPTKNEPKR